MEDLQFLLVSIVFIKGFTTSLSGVLPLLVSLSPPFQLPRVNAESGKTANLAAAAKDAAFPGMRRWFAAAARCAGGRRTMEGR